jgi:hypothetical protein
MPSRIITRRSANSVRLVSLTRARSALRSRLCWSTAARQASWIEGRAGWIGGQASWIGGSPLNWFRVAFPTVSTIHEITRNGHEISFRVVLELRTRGVAPGYYISRFQREDAVASCFSPARLWSRLKAVTSYRTPQKTLPDDTRPRSVLRLNSTRRRLRGRHARWLTTERKGWKRLPDRARARRE